MNGVINDWLFRSIGVFIFILIWFLVIHLNRSLQTYIATPEETAIALLLLFKSKIIIFDVVATLARTIGSFLPAVFLGVLAGMLLGFFKKLLYFLEVPIEFFRSLPSTTLLPVFILALGINDFARVGTAFFISFWIVLINTLYGVNSMTKTRVNVAISMRASKFQLFKEVIFWEILPYIFSAMRLALSISLIIILITEMIISSKYGLGVRLFEFQQTFKIDYLYAVIFLTGCIGFAINKILLKIQERILYWT